MSRTRKRRTGPRPYTASIEAQEAARLQPLRSETQGALVSNAADEEQVAKAKSVEKDTIKLESDDLLDIMKSKAGQRFLARLINMTGLHRSSVIASFDANAVFMLEGERNIGLQILSRMFAADRALSGHILMLAKEGE